jgi:hypothetical protein
MRGHASGHAEAEQKDQSQSKQRSHRSSRLNGSRVAPVPGGGEARCRLTN